MAAKKRGRSTQKDLKQQERSSGVVHSKSEPKNSNQPDNQTAGSRSARWEPVKKKPDRLLSGPKQARGSEQFDPLHQMTFWGLTLLLFFPPYFRGLFFAPEQEKALIFATLVFWLAFLWRWLKHDHKFLRDPLDWFALALPVIYIISSFTAVNKGLAIDEVVKNILYFMTYWSVSRLIRNQEDIHKLFNVIYAGAIGVALAGLATATGIIDIKDGFNVSYIGGIISSTFQYHNALGVYLAAVFFIGAYLWHLSNDRRRPVLAESVDAGGTARLETFWTNHSGFLYACGNFLLLAVLLGSKSRGALLVFGFVFVLYLIVAEGERRLSASLITGYLGVIAYAVMNKFIPLVQDKQYDAAWLWVAGGLLLTLAGQLAFSLVDRHVFSRWDGDGKRFVLAFAALAAVVMVAGGIFMAGKPQVLERVTSAEYLYTAYHRFYYMDAAREMIGERPLLGWGGGGWKEAYESYLTYRYTTREVHSYYFQVGVETGIPGVAAVSGIWLAFLYSACRLLRKGKDQARRQLVWLMVMVFLMIAGHALIDFDLSLSAITLVLWGVFGLVSALLWADGAEDAQRAKQTGSKYVSLVSSTVASLAVILLCVCLLDALSHYNRGVYQLRAGDTGGGVESLERAAVYSPFNAGYRVTLSQVYNGLGRGDDAVAEARSAVNLSPYSFAVRDNLVKVAIASGNHELASAEIENTLPLAPNNIEVYEGYAQNYVSLGVKELTSGRKDAARESFEMAAGVVRMIEQRAASLKENDLEMWEGPALALTDKIRLALGQAGYFLGNSPQAQEHLLQASNSDIKEIKGQALVWLALAHNKNGRTEQAEGLLEEANQIGPEFAQQYETFKEIEVL